MFRPRTTYFVTVPAIRLVATVELFRPVTAFDEARAVTRHSRMSFV